MQHLVLSLHETSYLSKQRWMLRLEAHYVFLLGLFCTT